MTVELVLYSSALDTCIKDAFNDFNGSHIGILRWNGTKVYRSESIAEHFGRLTRKFSRHNFLSCDLLVIAGDRYESFALGQAAFYWRIPIAHLFGGDISNGGHFDDHVRHALSHLSSVHFPVNSTAYDNLLAMKQEQSRVFMIGTPVVDDLVFLKSMPKVTACDVLISFNPMTLKSSGCVGRDVRLTMEALELIQEEMTLDCLATYPNHEPGSDEILEVYRQFEDRNWFTLVRSLGSPGYLVAIRDSRIVIGNSSSQVLEVPLLGQRCLLIGDRQKGRHKPVSVVHLASIDNSINLKNKIIGMLATKAPSACRDYGAPGVSRNIADVLVKLMGYSRDVLIQKNNPLQL